MQELVNRPGWASGNALVMLVTVPDPGYGNRAAIRYNYQPANAAKLHIEYIPATTTKYYSFNGQKVALRKNGVIYYLHTDHLGGTALVTKSDGSVESEQGYWAYGRYRTGGTLPTDYKFTGQKLDATGLMYFNARYYDPELGIFISPDSMVPDTTNLFDYNRYMYSRGNSMKYSDPTGHFVWATAAIGAVIGGAVTGATYMLTTDYADWKGSDIATVVGAGAIAGGLIGSGIGAAAGTLQMSAAMAMASSAAVASGSGALATAEASLLTNYAYGQELDKSDFVVSTATAAAEAATNSLIPGSGLAVGATRAGVSAAFGAGDYLGRNHFNGAGDESTVSGALVLAPYGV